MCLIAYSRKYLRQSSHVILSVLYCVSFVVTPPLLHISNHHHFHHIVGVALRELIPMNLHFNRTNRVGSSNFAPSPMSSRHGSQESLRHVNTLGSMSMLQVQGASVRDSVSAAQKKKGIKSSLGRFFSKKEKV